MVGGSNLIPGIPHVFDPDIPYHSNIEVSIERNCNDFIYSASLRTGRDKIDIEIVELR